MSVNDIEGLEQWRDRWRQEEQRLEECDYVTAQLIRRERLHRHYGDRITAKLRKVSHLLEETAGILRHIEQESKARQEHSCQ